ncbi:hypothetical protein ACFWB0_01825 [Rhodococcus sp. NPDC060086]|uniref:hypothetical protein n=1 Tax=Rhodococcus sp. NPDC060086 TaxID=3347055 RepID=UPI00366491AD
MQHKPSKKKSGKAGGELQSARLGGSRAAVRSTAQRAQQKKSKKNKRVAHEADPGIKSERQLLASVQLRIRDEQKQGYDRTASGQTRIEISVRWNANWSDVWQVEAGEQGPPPYQGRARQGMKPQSRETGSHGHAVPLNS